MLQTAIHETGMYTDTSWFNFFQVQLINDAYNLVIEAMLGQDSDANDIKEPYSSILVTLKQVKIPIASVDVPLGMPTLSVNPDLFTDYIIFSYHIHHITMHITVVYSFDCFVQL